MFCSKWQSDVLVGKRSRIEELTHVKSRTDFLEGAQNITLPLNFRSYFITNAPAQDEI